MSAKVEQAGKEIAAKERNSNQENEINFFTLQLLHIHFFFHFHRQVCYKLYCVCGNCEPEAMPPQSMLSVGELQFELFLSWY